MKQEHKYTDFCMQINQEFFMLEVIGLKCYFEIKSLYVCICTCLSSTIEQFWLRLCVGSLNY